MANREGKEFNVDKALDELINKHGTEEPSAATKRAAEEIESKSDGEEEGAKKKKRAAAVYACESNRAVGDAIHEMAAIYFKNKDARKGG